MEPVRDFYDRIWREYADADAHPLVAHALETQAAVLQELVLKERIKRVLDLGCGPAPATRPGWAPLVVYADIVTAMLKDLKLKLGSPAVCLDASHLPFKNGSFGLIWCSLLVDHVGSVSSWLEELFRVLQPGGRLGLACWDQSILPKDMYPEGGMRYRTAAGDILTVPVNRNWKEAQRLLAQHDPNARTDSYPIVRDEYVLQVTWARRGS